MTRADNTTRPVNFIRFHGLTLLVVENGGVEYVDPRPICELAGVQWKGARKSITSGDNAKLYGARLLEPVRFGVESKNSPAEPADSALPEADSGFEPTLDGAGGIASYPGTGVLHIRLDRSRMFLARINTNQMRAQGNVDAADLLLALQIEWAEALHQYETNGVAIKKGHKDTQAELATLYKLRVLAETPAERASLSALIAEAFAALGHPIDADAQQSLPLGQ